MVPASEDVIIISGVLSFGGFLISFAEITGAVVSVVVLSVEVVSSVVPVAEYSSFIITTGDDGETKKEN